MSAPGISMPLQPFAGGNPLLIANEWLGARLSQDANLGSAAREVLQQLCCSAALQCFEHKRGQRALERFLEKAGRAAHAVERALPGWSPGACWLRTTPERALLHEAWQCYRATRPLRSPMLDRMLLEALVCKDLRRAGLSARSRHSSDAERAPPADAGFALGAAALLLGWLWMQTAEPSLTQPGLELPLLTGIAGAAGLALWRPRSLQARRAARAAPLLAALRRSLSGETLDLRDVAVNMRSVVAAGVVWSPETLHVLVRMRMNAVPRPSECR